MDDHPTRRELEGLVQGGISAERARTVLLHLLRGCDACFQVLSPFIPARYFPTSHEPPPPPFRPEDYDASIGQVFSLFSRLNLDRQTSEDSKREALDLLTAGGLEALADAPFHLSGVPLLEALLERSWALRHDDPVQMVQLAHAAAIQASHLNPREVGAGTAGDLRCRAWTELANAYRVADELDRADQALTTAVQFLQNVQDDLLVARFFTVFASQQAARRRFELACETLEVVAAIYRRHGDEHLAGRTLIMQGIFAGYLGNAEEAIRSLRRGLLGVNEDRDPGLVFSAIQSQAWCLVDCGRFAEARHALQDLRRRNLNVGGRLGALKLRWLEGHIHVGLRELDLAQEALLQVKQGFEEAGLGYKAALAGLELGAVRFHQGDFAGAEEIVLECADVFLTLGIRRELMASLLVVRQAAASRYLSLTALQNVIDLLHQEERSPRATPQEES